MTRRVLFARSYFVVLAVPVAGTVFHGAHVHEADILIYGRPPPPMSVRSRQLWPNFLLGTITNRRKWCGGFHSCCHVSRRVFTDRIGFLRRTRAIPKSSSGPAFSPPLDGDLSHAEASATCGRPSVLCRPHLHFTSHCTTTEHYDVQLAFSRKGFGTPRVPP